MCCCTSEGACTTQAPSGSYPRRSEGKVVTAAGVSWSWLGLRADWTAGSGGWAVLKRKNTPKIQHKRRKIRLVCITLTLQLRINYIH